MKMTSNQLHLKKSPPDVITEMEEEEEVHKMEEETTTEIMPQEKNRCALK